LSAWLALSAASCGGAATSSTQHRASEAASRSQDYYVSTKGSDRGDGSRKRPWRTIAHAASRAGPGSTVHVAAGSYAGPVTLSRSGNAGRRIRFVSDTRWGARIRASSSGSLGVVQVSGDYVDVVGFDVSGRGGDGTAGIVVPGSYDRVIGNHVHDVVVACDGGTNGGGGIVAGGGNPDYSNHDIQVIGNLVHDIVGTPTRRCVGVQGIYASVARVRIVNNVVYRNADDCITSWHAASQLTIANNTSLDCPGAGVKVSSGGPGATPRGNFHSTVTNNMVYGNGQGIVETSDGHHPVGPGNRYINNLVYRSRSGDGLEPGDSLARRAVVSGTISADPRLLGESAHYRLSARSPAIDAGTNTAAPPTDFDGVPRPQGKRVDIGAFEWRSAHGLGG
jgi:Right handed beta helix region/Protein of unknown function (DUF1565)